VIAGWLIVGAICATAAATWLACQPRIRRSDIEAERMRRILRLTAERRNEMGIQR
jgi:hypothetical protein